MKVMQCVLTEVTNAYTTGGPGVGKTELVAGMTRALQAAGEPGALSAISNSIANFLTFRLGKMGVEEPEQICGTHSSKFWASLGPEYRHEFKLEIVKYMMSQAHILRVISEIRRYSWVFLEEVLTCTPQPHLSSPLPDLPSLSVSPALSLSPHLS